MDIGLWLRLFSGLGGVTIAAYGAVILVTGRAMRGDRRSFRRLADAGRYYLCFGSALALLVLGELGAEHHWALLAVAAAVVAVTLVVVAVLRYRPRRGGRR